MNEDDHHLQPIKHRNQELVPEIGLNHGNRKSSDIDHRSLIEPIGENGDQDGFNRPKAIYPKQSGI